MNALVTAQAFLNGFCICFTIASGGLALLFIIAGCFGNDEPERVEVKPAVTGLVYEVDDWNGHTP